MSGVNRVTLIGNLGADPILRSLENGDTVCDFRIAMSEAWKDKNGEKQERTEWMTVVTWGGLADTCGQYLEKGRQVYVEGSLRTREWTDKEGVKRYTTEVKATSVQFLGGGRSEEPAAPARTEQQQPARQPAQTARAGTRASTSTTRQAPPATDAKKPWAARGGR